MRRRVCLTRATTILPFSGFLEEGGCDASRHLEEAGISSEALMAVESLVPLGQVGHFIDDVARREGIDNLGLEVGARTRAADLGLFGMVLQQSLNLESLLEKLIRLVPMLNSGAQVWMETAESPAFIRVCIRHHVGNGRSMANEFALMLMIDAVRMATGPNWRPTTVCLDLTKRRDLSGFEALSAAKLESNPDFAAFEIPVGLMGAPVSRPRRRETPDLMAEERLRDTAPPTDLAGSVVRAIVSGMGTRILTIDEMAELVGTSVRTLQRELAQQGMIYREMVDQARYEHALVLMADPDVTVSEIALSLGYSDTANFSHAFLRWSGHPPARFRMQCQMQ